MLKYLIKAIDFIVILFCLIMLILIVLVKEYKVMLPWFCVLGIYIRMITIKSCGCCKGGDDRTVPRN